MSVNRKDLNEAASHITMEAMRSNCFSLPYFTVTPLYHLQKESTSDTELYEILKLYHGKEFSTMLNSDKARLSIAVREYIMLSTEAELKERARKKANPSLLKRLIKSLF